VAADLDDPELSFLRPWHKHTLMKLVKRITAINFESGKIQLVDTRDNRSIRARRPWTKKLSQIMYTNLKPVSGPD
jgi:hypothetical protein